MKTTNCPACAQLVSAQANKCPHCGQPIRRWARGLYAVKLTITIIVVGLLIWFVGSTACTVYQTHLDSSGHFVH